MDLTIRKVIEGEFEHIDVNGLVLDGNPRITAIGSLITVKTTNGAVLFKNVLVADVTVIDVATTATNIYATSTELFVRLRSLGYFNQGSGVIVGGTFAGLSDTLASLPYTPGQIVVVDSNGLLTLDDIQNAFGVSSWNGFTGDVIATTSILPEGTNLYYTDTRVSANVDVQANTTHRGRQDNPHNVDKTQVGLSNVDNTSDIAKPISTLQETRYQSIENKIAIIRNGNFSTLANVAADTGLAQDVTDNPGVPLAVFNQDGRVFIYNNSEWKENNNYVVEDQLNDFPATGELDTIYKVRGATPELYNWDGVQYVLVGGAEGVDNTFGQFRYITGVLDDLSNLDAILNATSANPRYYLVQTPDNSVYIVVNKADVSGLFEVSLENCRVSLFGGNTDKVTNDITGYDAVNSTVTHDVFTFPTTGITGNFTNNTIYTFDYWRKTVSSGAALTLINGNGTTVNGTGDGINLGSVTDTTSDISLKLGSSRNFNIETDTSLFFNVFSNVFGSRIRLVSGNANNTEINVESDGSASVGGDNGVLQANTQGIKLLNIDPNDFTDDSVLRRIDILGLIPSDNFLGTKVTATFDLDMSTFDAGIFAGAASNAILMDSASLTLTGNQSIIFHAIKAKASVTAAASTSMYGRTLTVRLGRNTEGTTMDYPIDIAATGDHVIVDSAVSGKVQANETKLTQLLTLEDSDTGTFGTLQGTIKITVQYSILDLDTI